MAYKVRKLDFRPWPVTITHQDCDAATGVVAEVAAGFIGHFRPFGEADLSAARAEVFGGEDDAAITEKIGRMPMATFAALEAAFFGRLMCGWAELQDDTGAPLPYSADTLRELCTGPDGPDFRRGINRALAELRFGNAPLGNSKASPQPGPAPDLAGAASAS